MTARAVVVPFVSEKAPPVMRPELEIEKRVEVEKAPAVLVEEAMTKTVWLVEEAMLCMEMLAYGEVVPTPMKPPPVMVVVPG